MKKQWRWPRCRAAEENMAQAGRDVAALRKALEILLQTVERLPAAAETWPEVREHTEGTQQVGAIVESVTEISEQTNLLA